MNDSKNRAESRENLKELIKGFMYSIIFSLDKTNNAYLSKKFLLIFKKLAAFISEVYSKS